MDEGLVGLGAILLVVGAVLLFLPFVCILGVVLMIVGFVLLLVGLVQEERRPYMFGYSPPYGPGPAYPPVAVPPSPMGQTAPPAATIHCPRCGQPLQYIYQYQRWYCPAERVYPWG